jgi:hypothetical protein
MDKETRNAIERATQRARKLLEDDFALQLEGTFDVMRAGTVAEKAGSHLTPRQVFQRDKIVAAIEHKRAAGMSAALRVNPAPAPVPISPAAAVADYLRDAAFTTLNRFVALKMLEARELLQECITNGERSAGYREFTQDTGTSRNGVALLPESAGYRLYIESLFDELSTEVKVLFDRRDPSSVLWPKRATFEQLLKILNATELARVWGEDETIGWVYQFFNGHDERKKMRDESAAPRNSRELAVRNQFFTPRYVVQFLTDNTLGRIWYEMRSTETVLAEKCEYMVRRPGEEFAPRAKKDPRDLRVLDPACGSGHFLLYAFDLLLQVYEEAYADPQSPKSEATGKTLAEGYTSLDALRKAAPGLVLEYNLHGVDIDPRCVQIAQLALWMRAQRAYRDFGVARAERARIRRSNIVVAEPLVADEQVAKEFVAKLGDAELGRVFTGLVESLSLAGDLGLLLRVETLVAPTAKRGQTGNLFAPPEERIRAALARFVSDEGARTNTRRRLFVDDAMQGVGLLAVAEAKFDIVLMNPPFGSATTRAKKAFEKAYPRTKNDIFAAFVERGIELLSSSGRVGAITSRTGFFLASFQAWRTDVLLSDARPVVLADLGSGVMDSAMVEAAVYCLERRGESDSSAEKAVFLRVLEGEDKAPRLLSAARDTSSTAAAMRFERDPQDFLALPRSPFAYWASDRLIAAFRKHPKYERGDRTAKQGMQTGNDGRFIRLWWEIVEQRRPVRDRWAPLVKGGAPKRYYSDVQTVVKWLNDGAELKAFASQYRASRGWGDQWSAMINATERYFEPGFTWPLRASRFAPSAMPAGCAFSTRGSAGLARTDELTSLIAFMCSDPFDLIFKLLLGRFGHPEFTSGALQDMPVPDLTPEQHHRLDLLFRQAWSIERSKDLTIETSHAFACPAGFETAQRPRQASKRDSQLSSIQSEIDRIAQELYGLDKTDCSAAMAASLEGATNDSAEDEDDHHDDDATLGAPLHGILSWLVGGAFARFDPRLATGERGIPPEPEPFDALPSRSPGMYPEGEEPADRPDILVDDEGHADDLAGRTLAVAEHVKVDVSENFRAWLAKEFFPLHIKMYSKSRRKAPIYWQLATPSAGYSVWLYIQAFSKDTLFRVQNDYVAPKLAHEERRLEALASELRDGAPAAQRKALAAQQTLVEELRAFLDEVKRVAPLWRPNLDDGVIINFAPLWRLVPHHKPWQKELKATWDELCDAKYDWAHLAMHLWPERVVPKCATDRSLAISHGLVDVFWVEGSNGKWTARKTPTRPVEELMGERESSAVMAALKSLLEAPAATGSAKKTKKGKANA